MGEAGVDITRRNIRNTSQHSKHVEELAHIEFDYVVTVCDNAAESCPHFRGNAKVVHQSFDDPPRLAREAAIEEEATRHYRRVPNESRDYINMLPEALKGVNHGE